MSGELLLELSGVHKGFGPTPVLRGLDLTVDRHEVVVLIGSSGSGKSTLLRCINGLETVDAGDVVLHSPTAGALSISAPGADLDAVRRRVGIVFQQFNLFPHLSVLANITLAPRRVLGRGRRDAEQAGAELLARFALADKATAYPDQLSGGQQQRVAIVRALAMDPEIVLFDEITSALDPELVGEVLDVVRELTTSGMTIVMATHEMSFARECADRVAFLDSGAVLEQSPPEKLFGDPTHARTREFLSRVG
ncbi:MAG TPA: amino acid ABC transporter ATP-binding protein [Candidatus Nanopelagicales bacterium]|jgi:polar amino acid transport system ATP-binding protein|nr:amino acid ABC transporter ATP-binding protein [Candidatus Nanopelagicales bacterium]